MSFSKSKRAVFISVFALSSALCAPASYGENLLDALKGAYNNNAQLNAARASVRAGDQDIALARSSFMPTVVAGGSYTRGWQHKVSSYADTGALQIQIKQNLFNGFQSYNNVEAAKANAAAQRQSLCNTEQNQLNNAVAAYVNVYISRRIAKLRQSNLIALEEQVRANRARLSVGEGTRTDLAQSEAARSRALSELSQAKADVKMKEAAYRQVVGLEPGAQLEEPALASDLPKTLEEAYAIAQKSHPAILAAKYAVEASSYSVRAKQGALLPQFDISASTSYSKNYSLPDSPMNGASSNIGLQFSMPLFTGGANSAQIRKSKELLGNARMQLDQYEAQVRESVEGAWASLEGLRSAVSAFRDSVKAAKVALNGRIHENRVGQATTLDVLNSRSELITMEVSLANAERNLVITSYNLKAAIGQLTAKNLKLDVPLYDSSNSFVAAERQLNGTKTLDGR